MSENATEAQDVIWLTQDAFDKLNQELDNLKTVGRPEVSAKIARAREEGDLSENGGYHAAREEQGQMEARIRILEDTLRRAQVGEAGEHGTVTPGSQVVIAYDGDEDDTDTFLLGSREVMGLDDSVDMQVYSPQSPLGAAIVGKSEGDTVSYEAPNGRTITVKILQAKPFQA